MSTDQSIAGYPVEEKRRVGGQVGCGRGPSAFFQGAPFPPKRPRNQPSPIPAARSCEFPGRATGGETFRFCGRIGAVSGSIAKAGTGNRRAAGGSAGRVRRPHGGKGVCGESAILTVAEACNNTTASFAGRWARRVACNQIDEEPFFFHGQQK